MCGIAGFLKQNKQSKVDARAVSEMFSDAQRSGKDSSGIYLEFARKSPILYKQMGSIDNLLSLSKVRQDISTATMGLAHTRQSSMGLIDLNNCQPFKVGKYVMLHNGHIWNLGDAKRSDSKELASKLDAKGFWGIKGYLDNGWANIVVYNTKTKRLVLSVDPNIPRLYTEVYYGVLYFASEREWLPSFCKNSKMLNQTKEYIVGKKQCMILVNYRTKRPTTPSWNSYNTYSTTKYPETMRHSLGGELLTHKEYQSLLNGWKT